MALMINPVDENAGGAVQRRPEIRAGQKVLWAAGTKWGESRAGNVKIDVRFVCVDDPDGGTDVGAFIWDTFTLTERAAWKLAQFARASGVQEPWDAENQQATDNILTATPILVDCEPETRDDGSVKMRCQRYKSWSGDITENMESLVADAEDFHLKGIAKANQSEADIPF